MKTNVNNFDVVVIGGGFYGCMLALHYKMKYKNIAIIELEDDLLLRASYNNQARIHNGYHYPRNFLTALSSHKNFRSFKKEFRKAVVDKYNLIYAVSKNNSKTSTSQFIEFCKQLGLPLYSVAEKISGLFNDQFIDSVFKVEEDVFDASVVRTILKNKIADNKIKIFYKLKALKIISANKNLEVTLDSGIIKAKTVVVTAYSGINVILKNSSLPLIPFKHESIEMPLIKVPNEIRNLGITIMDGPFFGVMPLPDRKLHTLHHVRYSPRHTWVDDGFGLKRHGANTKFKNSMFKYMINDAQRYIPILKNSEYVSSLSETRTLLQKNEQNDGRPILYENNYGFEGLSIVMGGKIDNIYDVLVKL